jgi:hypothetical protein
MTDNTETNSSTTDAAAAKKKRLQYAGIGIAVLLVLVWLSNGSSSEDSSSTTSERQAMQEEFIQVAGTTIGWGTQKEKICEVLIEKIALGDYRDEQDAANSFVTDIENDLQTPFLERTRKVFRELVLEDCFGL